MAAWTLEEAQAKLTLWLAAEDAVAANQSYVVDTGGNRRELTRANLAEIRRSINFWRKEVTRLESGGGGGPKIRYINPV